MPSTARNSSASSHVHGNYLTFTDRQTNIRYFVEPRPNKPVITSNGIEWPVQRILKMARRRLPGRKKKSTRYLVRWVGYPKACDTWEPARNLRECAALDCFERKSSKARNYSSASRA
ncbi:hypothetical protein D9611_001107 [Ephemerocybe angulata]|uniref:Chromo domain-containing protein n=1 Tax=Ephemerocybe angulata TaxID=980116 RepID=A0A8H5CK25_9AGAR|nr:hypothetical protein D9611_001107 [Tulosesus angulatus]